MTFKHKNCTIVIDDSIGKVYRDGSLMFRGDAYIAIKTMLQFTDNAEEVQEHFKPQLSMREKAKWMKHDEAVKRKNKTEKIITDATTIMHKSVNESARLKKDIIFFMNFLNYLF